MRLKINSMVFSSIIDKGRECGVPRLTVSDCEVLTDTASSIRAKVLVEIGGCFGTSSMVLGRVAKDNGGQHYCIESRPRKQWYDNIKSEGLTEYVSLLEYTSPWVPWNRAIDYLLIDGDHATVSAVRDFVYWEHYVRKGGCIAFHDIYGPPARKIWKAIDIINDLYVNKFKEISISPKQKEMGTVVFKKI